MHQVKRSPLGLWRRSDKSPGFESGDGSTRDIPSGLPLPDVNPSFDESSNNGLVYSSHSIASLSCPLGVATTSPATPIMSSTASQRALEYLEALPGTTFTKLYQQPSTALAIFRRMLPHLAKTMVMAMLYMPGPFASSDLDTWVKPDSESLKARDRALDILRRLKILFDAQDDNTRPAFRLSDAFARSLRLALTGGGQHRSFGVPCTTPDKTPVTIDYLDTFARRQWEAILYYVVGSASAGLGGDLEISEGTKKLLQDGEFVTVRGRTAMITQAGFTFLLQEINAQIWSLLVVYLEVSSSVCSN